MAKLSKEERERAQIAREHVSKARYWLSGFNTARTQPGQHQFGLLNDNGLRLTQILLDDLLK